MKSYKEFINDKFGEIRVVVIENHNWFMGKDIVKALGYNLEGKHSYTEYINKYVSPKGQLKLNTSEIRGFGIENPGRKGGVLLNEGGLMSLIQGSKYISMKHKNDFISWLNSLNLLSNDIIVVSSRYELEFLDQLEETLIPFNVSGIRQYKVLSYKIDYYIPSLNIAIEYDEGSHDYYSYEQQEGRQKKIEKELNCKFIRISDKNTNNYNVGLVIKQIFNL